jgi:hypothetical protein
MLEKLSAAAINRKAEFRKPGRYADGGGLYCRRCVSRWRQARFERRVLGGNVVMFRRLNLQERHPLVVLGFHYEQK